MKTKTTKKPAAKANRVVQILSLKKVWLTALIAVLLLQSIAIFALWVHATLVSFELFNSSFLPPRGLDKYLQANGSMPSKLMFQAGVKGTYLPLYPSVQENRMYIPEAKIYLPLNAETHKLLYTSYTTSPETAAPADTIITLNTTTNIDGILRMTKFESLNCAQKLAKITFNQNEDQSLQNVSLTASVALGDGRTMHIHMVSDPECTPFEYPEVVDKIIESLKQAQSY